MLGILILVDKIDYDSFCKNSIKSIYIVIEYSNYYRDGAEESGGLHNTQTCGEHAFWNSR